MSESMTITIPKEIIEISNISLESIIYLYIWESNSYDHEKILYLDTRRDKSRLCYGAVQLDHNYGFLLHANTVEKCGLKNGYFVCKQGSNINIETKIDSPFCYSEPSADGVKIFVPKEILNLKSVDFKRPVYLCKYNNRTYLTNKYNKSRKDCNIRCLGTVKLDVEHHIQLTSNACKALGISSDKDVLLCANGDSIVFVPTSYK